jgi:putative transcriptional regulator
VTASMKNRLKVYRATLNMTQEELAEKAHVTRQTIISIESGKYEPSIQLAFKLAKIFGVRIEDIFVYEE